MDIGTKVKELRKSRHLKQDDLAEILGITRGQISNLEHGRRSLNLKQLEILCNYFKVDMEYFGVSPTVEETVSLLERAKLIFSSGDITEEQKDRVYQDLMKIYLNHKSR